MSEPQIYWAIVYGWMGLSAVTFLALLFLSAPYGRHARGGWGPTLPSRAGWILMECPSVIAFLVVFALGPRAGDAAPLVLCAMWQSHYIHRAFVFPFRIRSGQRPMPLVIAGMGFTFNIVNSYMNARWLTALAPSYPAAWLADPRFLAGAALFVTGYAINQHADYVLLHLRAPGESGYKIPRGGMYRFITCPNYFGEIVEWTGWAIATWSLAGAAFALWTAANLVPRALAHHKWYREKFPDYPPERTAIIPFAL